VPVYPIVDLPAQAAVHRALRAAGLPAPEVLTVEADPAWLGVAFLVLSHLDGRAAGEVPGLEPWLIESTPAEQGRIHEQFIDALAAVHSVNWSATEAGTLLRTGVTDEIDYWSTYIEWAADGAPATQLVECLAWCRQHVPLATTGSLLWGDARLGNVMYDAQHSLVGLLDWELASIGPAEMDLAWYLALDELTARLARASVPGFLDRASFVSAYERRLGRATEDLAWHEVFALVRATAINDREARIAQMTGSAFPGTSGNDTPLLREIDRRIRQIEEDR
jgi:aminoglycoside phosphotransferase (APT) family kinase protein